jgi:Tat protein secretion system quality control protein TatD with DNase activity
VYRLIDTHAHLEEIENIEQTINDTKRANIVAIGEVGLDYDKRVRARADKERQKVVVPAGVENSPSPR